MQALRHFMNAVLASSFASWRDNVVEEQLESSKMQAACQRWQQSALASAFSAWVDWHLEQRDRWGPSMLASGQTCALCPPSSLQELVVANVMRQRIC